MISLAICQEPPRDQYKSEYLTPFLNFDEAATWLMKVKLNKKGQLEQDDKRNNSIFMWYEWPEGLLEYAPEKLIVTLRPSSFLFIEGWIPIKHLKQEEVNLE